MSDFHGIRAVIIEDDTTSIEVLRRLLQLHGAACDVIYRAPDMGLDPSSLNSPDVIFLDLEMPVENGYTVLQMLRQQDSLAGVPIIAYTTHTSHLNSAKDAGFDGLLGKPLDSSLFASQLSRILNGEPVWEVP